MLNAGKHTTISLEGLDPGIYFLRVISKGMQRIEKFVIQ
jgi:hypothetical protein